MERESIFVFEFKNAEEAVTVVNNWLSTEGFRLTQDEKGLFFFAEYPGRLLEFFEYSTSGGQLKIRAYCGSRNNPEGLTKGVYGSNEVHPYMRQLIPLMDELNRISQRQFTVSQNAYNDNPMENNGNYQYQYAPQYNNTPNQSQAAMGNPYQAQSVNQNQAAVGNPYQAQAANQNQAAMGNPYQAQAANQNQAAMGNPYQAQAANQAQAAMGNPYQEPYQSPQYKGKKQKTKKTKEEKAESDVVVGFVISLIGAVLPLIGFYIGIIFAILGLTSGIAGIKTPKKGLAIATIVLSSFDIVIWIIETAIKASML
jgi:hypothetical protein